MTTQPPEGDASAAVAAGFVAARGFRGAQLRIRAQYLREFADLWPILASERDINRWLRLNTALVRRWQAPSRSLAVEFYRSQGAAQIERRPDLIQPPRMPDAQIVSTLVARGPVVARRARLNGLDELEAWERAQAASMGAGGRLVLAGGRDALDAQEPLGYMRVTDGDPCYWCAMLAGRGAVYSSARNAGEMNEFHNSCGCTVLPIFVRSDFMSPEALRYRAIFDATYKNGGMSAYRKAYDAQRGTATTSPVAA